MRLKSPIAASATAWLGKEFVRFLLLMAAAAAVAALAAGFGIAHDFLPEGFDPAACKGLGMRIIRSFVERIGGELRIGRGDKNQGTRFTVLFS